MFAANAQECSLKLLHLQRISSLYEKLVVLALVMNAALFGVFVLTPSAHGKAPVKAAQPQETALIEAEAPSLAEECTLKEMHSDRVRGD